MKKFLICIFSPIIMLENNKFNFKSCNWFMAFLITLITFVIFNIIRLPESIAVIINSKIDIIYLDILAAILSFIFGLITILIFRSIFAKTILESTSLKKNYKNNISFLAITSLGLYLVTLGLLVPIGSLLPTNPTINESFALMENSIIYIIMSTLVVAPLVEEYIFRGVILNKLLNKYSPKVAIILTAILFGALHLNFQQFLVATMIGILYGYVYYRTKSIYLCTICHFFHNTFACLPIFVPDSTNATIVLCCMLAVIGISLTFIGIKKLKIPEIIIAEKIN